MRKLLNSFVQQIYFANNDHSNIYTKKKIWNGSSSTKIEDSFRRIEVGPYLHLQCQFFSRTMSTYIYFIVRWNFWTRVLNSKTHWYKDQYQESEHNWEINMGNMKRKDLININTVFEILLGENSWKKTTIMGIEILFLK